MDPLSLAVVLLAAIGAVARPRLEHARAIAVFVATLALAAAAALAWTSPRQGVFFAADALSALLVLLTALISWMVVLAAPRVWLTSASISLLFAGEALTFAALLARDARLLAVTWLASLLPLYVALRAAGEFRAARVYGLYTGAAAIAFTIGIVWLGPADGAGGWLLENWASRSSASGIPFASLVIAVLIRKAIFPFHSWLPPVFSARCLGASLLLVAPMLGAYALVRLAVPLYGLVLGEPLALIGPASLFTAVYAAGLALVQVRLERVVAWLATSQSAVVLVGLECHNAAGTVGAIVLWLAAGAALTAFGLVVWALESRHGSLAVEKPLGLYRKGPLFAWLFLASGLGLVAMPGTIGFASNDLLLRAVLDSHPYLGLLLFVAVAINGFTVLRCFQLLFFGRPAPGPVIDTLLRERVALIVPLVLLVILGLAPEPIVELGVAAAGRVVTSVSATPQ